MDPALVERVRKAVAKLNYTPDQQARALVSGRSRAFGLLISELTNPFFPELIQSFENIAVANGYEIIMGWIDSDPNRTKTYIHRMIQRKIEGMAVMTFGLEAPILRNLITREIPLVFIDTAPPNCASTVLRIDYHHGIRQAVQHLRSLGHADLGFITGPLHQSSAKLRFAAFRSSLQELGLKFQSRFIFKGNHTLEGGTAAAEEMLLSPERPTAILCSNDLTAIGALRTLVRRGIRIPEDISVIGYDDIHFAAYITPPLTTVGMSRADLARGAFEALLRSAQQAPFAVESQHPMMIQTELVIRESTGANRSLKG